MACSKCGKSKSSIEHEREREQKAIARREIAKQNAAETKAMLSQRRSENIARIREMRQARGR
jgi:hypothetical protein